MSVATLIVAAGRGSRAGEGLPKQYRDLNGEPVLTRTLTRFLSNPKVDRTLVVIHPDDRDLYEASIAALAPLRSALLPCVHGGDTRQDSVRNGLEALAASAPEIVLVHDAARPLVSPELIDRAIGAARRWDAAV